MFFFVFTEIYQKVETRRTGSLLECGKVGRQNRKMIIKITRSELRTSKRLIYFSSFCNIKFPCEVNINIVIICDIKYKHFYTRQFD